MSPEENKSPKQGVSSRVAIGKHSLHPVLVDFPIAFLTAALAIFISTFNLIARLSDHQASVLFARLANSAVVAISLVFASGLGRQLVFRHFIGVYGLEEGQAEENKANR